MYCLNCENFINLGPNQAALRSIQSYPPQFTASGRVQEGTGGGEGAAAGAGGQLQQLQGPLPQDIPGQVRVQGGEELHLLRGSSSAGIQFNGKHLA